MKYLSVRYLFFSTLVIYVQSGVLAETRTSHTVNTYSSFLQTIRNWQYRSGTVNSNTVNSKFHLIQSFFEIFDRFLSFHVYNAQFI